MRRATALLLGVALMLLGSAADAASDKTFAVNGIGITFEYPADFKLVRSLTFQKRAGSSAAARGAVALDNVNLIIVSRYNLRVAVTDANLARYKAEVDSVMGSLAGKRISGRRVRHGGLPGYEYRITLSKPPRGVSRMSVLFDRSTEYLINCQSTPPERQVLEAACRKALATLRRK
jgi:hypothetical protein